MAEGTAPLYRVLRVSPTVIYDGNTAPQDAQRVDFIVAGGTEQYVVIPNIDFDPAHVEDEIAAWAGKIAATQGIQGPDIQLDELGRPQPPEAQ